MATMTAISGRRRAPSRRDKKVNQLLRHPGIHPVTMNIKLMFYAPAEIPVDEAELLSSKLDVMAMTGNEAKQGTNRPPSQSGMTSPQRMTSALGSKPGRASQALFSNPLRASISTPAGRRSSTLLGQRYGSPVGTLEPHMESPEMLSKQAQKATANSSYIHYEFTPPHDDRPSKNDVVIHHNSGKVFVDGEMRSASWEKLSDDVLCGSWTHSYDIAVGSDIISDFYYKGMEFTIFDTRDRVSTRARFDRPKPGGPAAKLCEYDTKLHPNIPSLREPPKDSVLGLGPPPRNAVEAGQGARLKVDMRTLFAGDLECSAELTDMESTGLQRLLKVKCIVSLNKPLLSPEQQVLVNPLVITIHRAENLPSTPVSYETLDALCQPTAIKFRFYGNDQEEYAETVDPHGPVATFNYRHVVLTGLLDRDDFAYWLEHNAGLEIQIHDRARKTKRTADGSGLFGQRSDEDVETGNAAFSRADAFGRAIAAADIDADAAPWDPFGVATVHLRAVILGTRKLKLSVPILPCQEREPQRFSLNNASVDRALHAGHYISAGSTLEVTVELMHARRFDEEVDDGDLLVRAGVATPQEIRKRRKKASIRSVTVPRPVTASRPPSSAFDRSSTCSGSSCSHGIACPHGIACSRAASATMLPITEEFIKRPFGRLVIVCRPHFIVWVTKLRTSIHQLNLKTLNLDKLPATERKVALDTFFLSEEQGQDPYLDVITGVQIETHGYVIMILEGLVDGSLDTLLRNAGWPDAADVSNFRTLYSSKIGFTDRLYDTFGIAIKRIHIPVPIEEHLAQQELYINGHPLHKCLGGLTCIHELQHITRIKDVIRGKYFPTVADLVAVAKSFALPDEALEGGRHGLDGDDINDMGTLLQRSKQQQADRARYRPIIKPPLDMSNPDFDKYKQRPQTSQDHILLNKASIRRQSKMNHQRRQSEFSDQVLYYFPESDHHYSSMRQNKSVMAREKLKETLRQTYGEDKLFAFSNLHHVTSSFSVHDEEQAQQQVELRSSQRSSKSTRGFDTTTRVIVDLSRSKVSELRASEGEFEESLVNRAKLTFDRNPLPWSERHKDLRASLSSSSDQARTSRPSQIFTSHEDELEAQAKERAAWRAKLVVDDPNFHVLNASKGEKPSNAAVDRIQDVLRDSPRKASLRILSTHRSRRTSLALDLPFNDVPTVPLTLGDGTARTGYVPLYSQVKE
eukprot:m.56633 g.56633  ORF g.56633 m.56633 type:complete len:1198 (-) comp13025_c1_seq1:418-4011(-)